MEEKQIRKPKKETRQAIYGKTEDDCCRHGQECISCHKWYCADDEMLACIKCYKQENICFGCLLIDETYDWELYCKYCWRHKDDKTKKRTAKRVKCSICNRICGRLKKVLQNDKYECKKCFINNE